MDDLEPALEVTIGPWWLQAFTFRTTTRALQAYEKATAVLRARDAPNVSVYRVQFNGKPLLALVGELPLSDAFEQRFTRATAHGSAVMLPDDVTARLLQRSLDAWQAHPGFIERRNINEVVE